MLQEENGTNVLDHSGVKVSDLTEAEIISRRQVYECAKLYLE